MSRVVSAITWPLSGFMSSNSSTNANSPEDSKSKTTLTTTGSNASNNDFKESLKPSKSSRSMYLRQKAADSLVVTEIDKFLYVVESKLEDFEQFGLEKLDSLDEQAKGAYVMMVKLRDEVIIGGKRKAGALKRFVESVYGDEQASLAIKKRTPSADFGNYVDYKKYKEKATTPLLTPSASFAALPRKSMSDSLASLPEVVGVPLSLFNSHSPVLGKTSSAVSRGASTASGDLEHLNHRCNSSSRTDVDGIHSSGSSDDIMSCTGSISSLSSIESYTFYGGSPGISTRGSSREKPALSSRFSEHIDDGPLSPRAIAPEKRKQDFNETRDIKEKPAKNRIGESAGAAPSNLKLTDSTKPTDSESESECTSAGDDDPEDSEDFFLNHSFQEELNYIEEMILENHLKISIQKALQNAASRLLTFEELPVPWQENPYISRGYRFCRGYTDCIFSMGKFHNETCNIWSHLLGFFAMLGLAFYHWPSTESWQLSSSMDKVIMIVFLVCACKCLMFSAIWHTFAGISRLKVKKSFACVDYTGITLLIAASILTTEYSALYCRPVARTFYMTATAISGLGGVLFTWDPSFDKPESRTRRITFFIGFAVAGALGFLHAACYHGITATWWFYYPISKSIACYLLGVVAYGFLFPERYCPGWIFDYVCMSHNLWHVCVFGGIYYHYMATIKLLEGAKQFSCINPNNL